MPAMMPALDGAALEHAQPGRAAEPGLGGGRGGLGAAGQRRRHGLAQPARRPLQGAGVCSQPQAPAPGWAKCVRAPRRAARAGRPGGGVHARGHRAGHRGRPRPLRHARGHRAQRRAGRGPAPGHARRGAAAPAARAGPCLRRHAVAAHRAECQHRPQRRDRRRTGLRVAVGFAGQRDARLGAGPRHRLLAGGVAGPACRHRCRRPARPTGQRFAHALHPAVRGGGGVAAQVHVGSAGRRAQQAGDRGALRPRRAGSAGRCRPGVRRGLRPCRHAARGHAAADVPGGGDAGALSQQPQRAAGDPEQRQRRRRVGRRRRRAGRGAAVHAAARDPAAPAAAAAR